MNKNDIIILKIEDIGIDGEGIGKLDGMTFFVKDAVIGDEIEARITKIDEEMAGDAAYDHIRLTELTVEKEKLESRLMELYEFLDGCGEAI